MSYKEPCVKQMELNPILMFIYLEFFIATIQV